MAGDVTKWLTDNWTIVMSLAGGGSVATYSVSTLVKHLPRCWPVTLKDLYFCFVDTAQDLVSQKTVSDRTKPGILVPSPLIALSPDVSEVAHADPINLPAFPAQLKFQNQEMQK